MNNFILMNSFLKVKIRKEQNREGGMEGCPSAAGNS